MTVDAGRLRDRVVVERPVEGDTALGATTLTWQWVIEVWAEVRSISFQEAVNAQQSQAQVTHVVTMRHLHGLEGTMRLRWRGKVLEILSVLEQQNRSVHELVCREVVLT